MSASPSHGERPHMQGAFRRSFTLPARQLSVHEKAGLDKTDADADILYSHPIARIIKFSPPTESIKSNNKADVPADTDYPVDTIETLPWRSRTETLAASGQMIIEKVRGSTNFLKCQDVMHAILRNSQCWCVDGESKFVLRVRKFQYYRIELPSTTEEDKAKVEELKKVFPTVLRYERTPCPFIRAFTVELPDDAITPRRKGPWKRRDSSQPNTPDTDTETPPLRRANTTKSWHLRSPPTSYPKNAPGYNFDDERGRPGSSAEFSRRSSVFETSRNSSPAGYVRSDDGTDSEHHGSEHDSELGATTDRSQSASPRKHLEALESNTPAQRPKAVSNSTPISSHLATQTKDINKALEQDPGKLADPEHSIDFIRSDRDTSDAKDLKTLAGSSRKEHVARETALTNTDEEVKKVTPTYLSAEEHLSENVPTISKIADLLPTYSARRDPLLQAQPTKPANDVKSLQEKQAIPEPDKSSSDSSEASDDDVSTNIETSLKTPDSGIEISGANQPGPVRPHEAVESQPSSAESESDSGSGSESGTASASESQSESASQSQSESESLSESGPELSYRIEPEVHDEHDQVQSSPTVSSSTSTSESSSESEAAIEQRRPGHQDGATQQQISPQEETIVTKTTTAETPDQDEERQAPSTPVLKSSIVAKPTLELETPENANSDNSEDDDDNLSTVSSNDSFHTMASPRKGFSRAESSDIVSSQTMGYRSTFASTSFQHKRDISEVTVKASNGSDSASFSPRREMQENSGGPKNSDLLRSDAYGTPSADTAPAGAQGQEGLRERLKARRSFSPLPPASTIFNDSQIRHDSGSGHMTKVILQKLIIAPIEVAVMFVHILARIAGGATVNDLLSGELFKRPENHRTMSELANRLTGGHDNSDTEDDYGVPVRGRRRSIDMRVTSVFDEENEGNPEDVD